MEKKIGISQSCFIPWRGYFDYIRQVDEFIIWDGLKFNWSSWRNRNLIKTPQGLQWLTIPVKYISSTQTISETCLVSQAWRQKHWGSIFQHYRKAHYFSKYSNIIEELYLSDTADDVSISDINYKFLQKICVLLEIPTKLTRLNSAEKYGDKNQTLVHYCKQYGAGTYVTVPNTKAYINPQTFEEANIKLEWMKYDYQEYTQLYSPFVQGVSIIDTIFNCSPKLYFR